MKCPKCSALLHGLNGTDSCWSCGKFLVEQSPPVVKMKDEFKRGKTAPKHVFAQYRNIVERHFKYIKGLRSKRCSWESINLQIEKLENKYLTSNSLRNQYIRLSKNA